MFVFLVLHYKTDHDTRECIRSIENLYDKSEYRIVVEDNGSDNGSLERLVAEFGGTPEIHFIANGKNLGVSNGFNKGINYIKKNIPDYRFIACVNNDIILVDSLFIQKIKDFYNREGFDILGPDTFSLREKVHQNPGRLITSLPDLNKAIRRMRIKSFFNQIFVEDVYYYLKNKYNLRPSPTVENYKQLDRNAPLFGACFVFSRRYLEQKPQVFDSRVFMYMEEDILYNDAQINGYKIVYYPDTLIYHTENSSTEAAFGKGRRKRSFYYRNWLNSAMVLKEALCAQSEDIGVAGAAARAR